MATTNTTTDTTQSNGMNLWEAETALERASEPEIVPTRSSTTALRAPDDDTPLGMMVTHAQSIVRDPARLLARSKQIGGLLAKGGFYRFPMGGQDVSGPSIGLAQALAQEWGGIAYQVRILRSEPLATGGKRIHFRATVTDMKSLVAAQIEAEATTAPPPAKFAGKADQVERWHSMQVQSASSKVVRNAILDVLPRWFVDVGYQAAIDAENTAATGGKPLPQARLDALSALGGLGLTQGEAEAHVGEAMDMWAAPQLSALRDLYGNVKHGRVSIEQFRAGLAPAAAAAQPEKGARSALGLGKTPTNGNGSTATPKPAAKAESRAEAKPAPAPREPEPPTAREPGDDDDASAAEQAAYEAFQAQQRANGGAS